MGWILQSAMTRKTSTTNIAELLGCSYIDVEPFSGITMRERRQLQLNAVLQDLKLSAGPAIHLPGFECDQLNQVKMLHSIAFLHLVGFLTHVAG